MGTELWCDILIFSSENCMSFRSELSFRNRRSITLEK